MGKIIILYTSLILVFLSTVIFAQPKGVKVGLKREKFIELFSSLKANTTTDTSMVFDNIKYKSINGTLCVFFDHDTVSSWSYLFDYTKNTNGLKSIFDDLNKKHGKSTKLHDNYTNEAWWYSSDGTKIRLSFFENHNKTGILTSFKIKEPNASMK